MTRVIMWVNFKKKIKLFVFFVRNNERFDEKISLCVKSNYKYDILEVIVFL